MRHFALVSLAFLAACHQGTPVEDAGPSGARDVAMPGAPHAVSLDGPDDVEVTRGAFAIRATGPKAILGRLTFETRDGLLHIGRKPGVSFNESGEVAIHVSMPAIDGIAIAGSGNASLDRADAAGFAAAIGGSGNLSIKQVTARVLSVEVEGSGDFDAAGHAGSIKAALSGSGSIDLSGLTSDAAAITLDGSGSMKLGTTQRVTGAVSGSGDLDVAGHPACTVATTGSGTVTCG